MTRVWPVFDYLFANDATGRSWLPLLLRLGRPPARAANDWMKAPGELLPSIARFSREIPGNLSRVLGVDGCAKLKRLRGAFESEFAPPASFLGWMLAHPERLTWPKERGGQPRRFVEPTQHLRELLLGGDAGTQARAMQALKRAGAKRSRRQWWAFEGWTSVDCWLETDRLVLFIEGKRTEPIASATDWFPARNQVARNVEVAAELAKQPRKDFGVMVCTEQPVTLTQDQFNDSLPHLGEAERNELYEHYLGCVTWQQVRDALCPASELPASVDMAVEFCARFR